MTEASGGRFSFSQVFEYLNDGRYPDGFGQEWQACFKKDS